MHESKYVSQEARKRRRHLWPAKQHQDHHTTQEEKTKRTSNETTLPYIGAITTRQAQLRTHQHADQGQTKSPKTRLPGREGGREGIVQQDNPPTDQKQKKTRKKKCLPCPPACLRTHARHNKTIATDCIKKKTPPEPPGPQEPGARSRVRPPTVGAGRGCPGPARSHGANK